MGRCHVYVFLPGFLHRVLGGSVHRVTTLHHVPPRVTTWLCLRFPPFFAPSLFPRDPIDVQFLQSAQEKDVRSVYGENYDRLLALKRTLDPTDLFKHAMFVRSDGSEGPDEWKQLPPMTEDRVRVRNQERAKRPAAAAVPEDGTEGSENDTSPRDKGKGKVISPHTERQVSGNQVRRAEQGSPILRRGGRGAQGSEAYEEADADTSADGAGESNSAGATSANDMEIDGPASSSPSPTKGTDSSTAPSPIGPPIPVATLIEPSDAPTPPTPNGNGNGHAPLDGGAAAGNDNAAVFGQSVQQRTGNVPSGERSAAGVVDPVTQGESRVM